MAEWRESDAALDAPSPPPPPEDREAAYAAWDNYDRPSDDARTVQQPAHGIETLRVHNSEVAPEFGLVGGGGDDTTQAMNDIVPSDGLPEVHAEAESSADAAVEADRQERINEARRQLVALETETASQPEAWGEGQTVDVTHGPEASAEVTPTTPDVPEARAEVNAAYEGHEPHTIDDCNADTDAWASENGDAATSGQPADLPATQDASSDASATDQTVPADDDTSAGEQDAPDVVHQAHQDQETRAAEAEAIGATEESETLAASPDAHGEGPVVDEVRANGDAEERVAEPSEVSGATPDSETDRISELTPAELGALQDYTALAYESLNGALWRGSVDDVAEVADLSHDLSSALEKLPPHEGQVIRGSEPGRPVEAYDLSRYQPGERIVENGYISTTTNPDGLLPHFDGPVAWVIESKSGRDVSPVSSVSGESEVLFDRFTPFTVLSKEFDPTSGPGGTWIIYMEEESRH